MVTVHTIRQATRLSGATEGMVDRSCDDNEICQAG